MPEERAECVSYSKLVRSTTVERSNRRDPGTRDTTRDVAVRGHGRSRIRAQARASPRAWCLAVDVDAIRRFLARPGHHHRTRNAASSVLCRRQGWQHLLLQLAVSYARRLALAGLRQFPVGDGLHRRKAVASARCVAVPHPPTRRVEPSREAAAPRQWRAQLRARARPGRAHRLGHVQQVPVRDERLQRLWHCRHSRAFGAAGCCTSDGALGRAGSASMALLRGAGLC